MEESIRDLLVGGASRLGVALDDRALARFSTYLNLLQLWGRKINLTTRLEAEDIVIYHFLDSLAGIPILLTNTRGRLVDLGAGAGLPSLPLKFALPDLGITLIDSVRKKVAFCREVIRETGLSDAEAVWGRAEELGSKPEHRNRYQWAVSRALSRSAEVVGMALPLLAKGGKVILYKGDPESDELAELETLCGRIGATWHLHQVSVPFLKGARALVVVTLHG